MMTSGERVAAPMIAFEYAQYMIARLERERDDAFRKLDAERARREAAEAKLREFEAA